MPRGGGWPLAPRASGPGLTRAGRPEARQRGRLPAEEPSWAVSVSSSLLGA